MDLLKLKLATDSSEFLTISEYEVDAHLKEKYSGKRGELTKTIDMKIKDVEMKYIQDSFKVQVLRYLSFNPNANKKSNVNRVTFTAEKKSIIWQSFFFNRKYCISKKKKNYFQLNFINLSYGNKFDFNKENVYQIPVEFILGKDKLNNQFKLFIKYDTFSEYEN